MKGSEADMAGGLPRTRAVTFIILLGAISLFADMTYEGARSITGPYLGVLAWAHFVSGWPWPQAQIAGIALSTTSVAVVYAVMVETGFNNTEIGKIILAACFINDIGTVLALGLVFANYNFWLLGFAVATVFTVLLLPRVTPWFFARLGSRVSEPQIKFVPGSSPSPC